MASLLIVFNALVFLLVALLHLYWVLGGKWAINAALPTHVTGDKVFIPGKLITLMVVFGLLLFALVTVSNLGRFNHFGNKRLMQLATQIIGAMFIIRAIGDFKFVGFTKSIKNTKFAVKDTRIYTPLCLLIGIISFMIIAIQ